MKITKHICSLISVLLILCFPVSVNAEPPVKLNDVGLEASLIYSYENQIYTYEYVVLNPPLNTVSINSVYVDIRKHPYGKELSSDGLLIIGSSRQSPRSFNDEIKLRGNLNNLVIPVGLSTENNSWGAGIASSGSASFGVSGDSGVLSPGQKTKRLFIQSRGIPGIRFFKADPSYIASMDEISEYNKQKKEPFEYIDEAFDEFYENLAYHTTTIGPTAPPAELDPASFIDNIISMKHEAADLGWITNQGIVISLDQKLDAAKQKLAQGNTRAAKNILAAFIKEVEAQGCENHEKCPKGKHILPEAYALLKYNAKYLVDNLE